MAVCEYCRGKPHEGQPENCRGGTWCDCQHKLPIVRTMVEREVIPFPEAPPIGFIESETWEPKTITATIEGKVNDR